MPKTEYQYIEFKLEGLKAKTEVWGCYNRRYGPLLGHVVWSNAWRQYTYETDQLAGFSAGCLRDIAEFLEQMNREHKEKKGGVA